MSDIYQPHSINPNLKSLKFKEMKMPIVRTLGKLGYKYMYKNSKCEIDLRLKKYLDGQINLVANNFDSVGLITGMEGSSKSTLAITSMMTYICHVLGMTFDMRNVCFSLEHLNDCIMNLPEGSIIELDEFVLMGSSDETMTRLQRLLRRKFTLIRKKRLFILLVIPSIHMLNKYFALQRTRYCINCTCMDAKRGYARLYGYGKKNYLCMNGHKTFSYDHFQYDTEIRFLDLRNKDIVEEDIIDWDEYEKKKEEAIQKLNKEEEGILNEDKDESSGKRMAKANVQQYILIKKLLDGGFKPKDIIKDLGINRTSYYDKIRFGEQNLKSYYDKCQSLATDELIKE